MHEVTQTDPTRVSVSLGYKMNIGNYESLDFHFSVSDSARPGETAGQAFERVYAFVEQKLLDKVNAAREDNKA